MRISNNCIELVKFYESLHDGDLFMIGLQPKMCPAGIWTEGYGHAMIYNGKFLKGIENKELAYRIHSVNDEKQAVELLSKDLEKFESGVNSLLKVKVLQNQFDSLVSFSFNVGLDIDDDNIAEGLGDSTLLRYVNKGNIELASKEFEKWNKCNGKVLPGLIKRRESEKYLFTNGILKF